MHNRLSTPRTISFCRRITVLTLILVGLVAEATAQKSLAIPPTIEGPTFNLELQRSSHEFLSGLQTPTYGINGSFLGPTLLLTQGQAVQMNVHNGIGESTTIHWHGMHVSAENDGGPHTVIEADATWSPAFTVLDQASTMWYHPHLHEKTDEHVYRGLAGMIIINDPVESALQLPREYGVDDIPLVIQDRTFASNGSFVYNPGRTGAMGDTVVMNGTLDARLTAPAQMIRFRALNGSNARVYNIGISDNRSIFQIASDGGLLEAPVSLQRIRLAPGERAEFILDLTGEAGSSVQIMSFASELTRGEPGGTGGMGGGGGGGGGGSTGSSLNGIDFRLLDVQVTSPNANAISSLPPALVTLSRLEESQAQKVRPMILGGGMGAFSPFVINGVSFDFNVINEVVPLENIEIWEVQNQTQMPHPFHIHDVQFRILDRNGVEPPLNERGRKDDVLVYPDETVRFITQFRDFANPNVPFMYHCHFLGHEDEGMMGQFVVVDQTQTSVENVSDGEPSVPLDVGLYPNPFASMTNIVFSSETAGRISVTVFDLLGRRVDVLLDEYLSPGVHTAVWDSSPYPVGVYQIRVESFERVKGLLAIHL